MNIHLLGAFDTTIKKIWSDYLEYTANHYIYHYKGKEDVQPQRLRDLAARGCRVEKLSKGSSPISLYGKHNKGNCPKEAFSIVAFGNDGICLHSGKCQKRHRIAGNREKGTWDSGESHSSLFYVFTQWRYADKAKAWYPLAFILDSRQSEIGKMGKKSENAEN